MMTAVENVPSTGFDSEKKAESEVSSTSNAPRKSKGSTIFICCSDASLNDPSDVPMDVKVEVGPSRSDSAVTEDVESTIVAKENTAMTGGVLPHTDPFPDEDDDDDEDEDADHQVERLTWDVAEPGSGKSTDVVGNSSDPPIVRDIDFGAGGRVERDAGGFAKRYTVDVAERDPGRIPKRYTVDIEERTGGQVSKRYCGEIAESDAGGFPDRDAGGYPAKSATRDAGGFPDRDVGGYPDRYPARMPVKDTGGYSERYPPKFTTRDAGGFLDKGTRGYQERYSASLRAKDAGGYPQRYPGRVTDQDTGGYQERYSGRSAIRRDPADIPKRYPGAADVDPVQTLKRYLGKIAEDDPDAMRKRILDYIADRDNRQNEKRYTGEDAGDISKKYSTGVIRTSFGVLAPSQKVSQNDKRNGSLGYGSMIPPPKKKGSAKSKTFSTVSRALDSITETFYTFDAEGGEELRVLVDGWPKLEVTRAPGSLLYEGNWVDNPETRSFGEKCKTTSVIEANGCKIRMDRRCNGEEEFIALYKDDVLICKAGRRMV